MTRKEYLQKIGKIIVEIKELGNMYYDIAHRPLGITGEIAEYEAVRLLNVHPKDARQAGYDAVRKKKWIGEEKIQIKGRALQMNSKPGQRVGTINLKGEWDTVVLVIMDSRFNPQFIYEAKRSVLKAALLKPGSKARNIRGQLSVSKFISISDKVWQA